MPRSIIRDSVTGRFVSQSTFNRSVSHGGTRYVKEEIKPKEKEQEDIIADEFDDWEEWAITLKYP